MSIALTLLGEVRWRGAVVAGQRPQALLAALASGGSRPVSDGRLIELVWGDDAPGNAAKACRCWSRARAPACGPDAIVREPPGTGSVSSRTRSTALGSRRSSARPGRRWTATRCGPRALARRGAGAGERRCRRRATTATAPLGELRRSAAEDVASARVVSAQASSRVGAHAEALPALEAAHAESPDDESLLADLLRSEAAVRGPGAALERYERYRRDLRERLGTSPGEPLRRVQRELLALDQPMRQGLRYDATSLLGRDRDIEALRGLLASSRVVSIVGPGGLGKTRLAHVLARDARQPVVHVVELVGVTAADDVVGGGRLGARRPRLGQRPPHPDPGAARRPARRASPSGSPQSPSLLVLDNCEHLVGAVAELVAFLVSQTADLRVLTTSRSPLAIAAEHVYLLGELDAGRRRRAVPGARPGRAARRAARRRGACAASSPRLDGLPLAIELAAAKVRAMAVEEIDRRLENRFALLRGGDRSAPDRHRTLLAVIDWSWNLLGEAERRALRRLALFNDGFTLEAAEAMLGDGALDAVQGLVDQSLLSVRETDGGLRYRMLETVREFGQLQLVEAGEDDDARAARRRWAAALRPPPRRGPHGPGPVRGRRRRRRRGDQPRRRAARDDRRRRPRRAGRAARDARVPVDGARRARPPARRSSGAIAEAVDGWTPPPELEDVARAALVRHAQQRDDDERRAQRADPDAARAARPRHRATRASRAWCASCWSMRAAATRRLVDGAARAARPGPRPVRRPAAPASGSATSARTPATRSARSRPPSARSRSAPRTRGPGRRRCCTTSSPG